MTSLLAAGIISLPGAEDPKTSDLIKSPQGDLRIEVVQHATFVLRAPDKTIYVDPVGGADRFSRFPAADLILLTDIHGDHLDLKTLEPLVGKKTQLVAPPAAAERLTPDLKKQTTVLSNGASASLQGIPIEAIPAYNLTPDRLKFHAKGRGNGYLLTLNGQRIYISGDTEDIPEMRALKNIDVAFLCMNLPYTMTVEQAASAVKAFRPRVVYPYHYRGSDLDQFAQLAGKGSGIDVRLLNWYP